VILKVTREKPTFLKWQRFISNFVSFDEHSLLATKCEGIEERKKAYDDCDYDYD
jgi:hypothetical protein